MPANTPVILRLKASLYKKDAKPGYSLEFEVGYDLVVNGQIGIQSGTAVIGTLRQVDHAAKGPPKLLIDWGPAKTVGSDGNLWGDFQGGDCGDQGLVFGATTSGAVLQNIIFNC